MKNQAPRSTRHERCRAFGDVLALHPRNARGIDLRILVRYENGFVHRGLAAKRGLASARLRRSARLFRGEPREYRRRVSEYTSGLAPESHRYITHPTRQPRS